MDKARVRSDLGTDGFDFQQFECAIDCFLLEGYSSFNKSSFLFQIRRLNCEFPIFGAHVVHVLILPAVQQSQRSWFHGAKELDKERWYATCEMFL